MSVLFHVTLKEAMRKRTFLVMCLISLLYLILWGVAMHFFSQQTVHQSGMDFGASRLTASAGLSFAQSLTMLLTIMLGAGAVSSEMESGLIHGILSRPIRRTSYLSGKFLGLAVLACGFATALYFAVLAIGALFGLSILNSVTVPQLLQGLYFYLLSPLCMLCLVFLLSIRFRTIPSGSMALFILILGNVAGTLTQIGNAIGNTDLENVGSAIVYLSPFSAIYNKMESVLLPGGGLGNLFSMGSGGGEVPDLAMLVYIHIYMTAFFLLAHWRFGKKDIA